MNKKGIHTVLAVMLTVFLGSASFVLACNSGDEEDDDPCSPPEYCRDNVCVNLCEQGLCTDSGFTCNNGDCVNICYAGLCTSPGYFCNQYDECVNPCANVTCTTPNTHCDANSGQCVANTTSTTTGTANNSHLSIINHPNSPNSPPTNSDAGGWRSSPTESVEITVDGTCKRLTPLSRTFFIPTATEAEKARFHAWAMTNPGEVTVENCATCSDGVMNQTETGVDCGGPCASCGPTIECSNNPPVIPCFDQGHGVTCSSNHCCQHTQSGPVGNYVPTTYLNGGCTACGNGSCDPGESCNTCLSDCGCSWPQLCTLNGPTYSCQ